MSASSVEFGSAVVSKVEFEASLEQRRLEKARLLNQAPVDLDAGIDKRLLKRAQLLKQELDNFNKELEQHRVKKASALNKTPISDAQAERLKADNERIKQELKRRALENSAAQINYAEAATDLITSMKKGLYTQ